MSDFKSRCVSSGAHIEFSKEKLRETVSCKNCGTLQDSTQPKVKFNCVGCEILLESPPELIGEFIRCDSCDTKQPVPDVTTSGGNAYKDSRPRVTKPTSKVSDNRKKPRVVKKNRTPALLLTLLFATITVVYSQSFNDENNHSSEEILSLVTEETKPHPLPKTPLQLSEKKLPQMLNPGKSPGSPEDNDTYKFFHTGDWHDKAAWRGKMPMGNGSGKIVNAPGKTLRLTKQASVSRIVLADFHIDNTTLEIDGGVLTTTSEDWVALGYRNSAKMVIKNGGSFKCFSRLDIGMLSSKDEQKCSLILEKDAESVVIAGALNIGFKYKKNTQASATAVIKGGSLFARRLEISKNGNCSLILSGDGMVVLNSDQMIDVHNWIRDGIIKSLSPNGQVIFDYNSSYPDKTTIRVIQKKLQPQWTQRQLKYSDEEYVITPFDALKDFGIVGDGVTDVGPRIQEALSTISSLGGGTLYLPEGMYKVKDYLAMPPGVTLRGDWQKPEAGQSIKGTILMAYAGRHDHNGRPFIRLQSSAGVKDLSIWYPEQKATAIVPYSPTLANGGAATVENLTLVNAYFGYTCFKEVGYSGRSFVRNVYGTPLKTGVEFDCLADVGRIESLDFNPDYWAGSGLPGAPKNGENKDWLYEHGTGLILRRIDWSAACYVNIKGYNQGLALLSSRQDGRAPNGQCYDFNIVECKTGVFIDKDSWSGMQYTKFNIKNAETGILVTQNPHHINRFHTCNIESTKNPLVCNSPKARIMLANSNFKGAPLNFKMGFLTLMNSHFEVAGEHIRLGNMVLGASLLGNRFNGKPVIKNNSKHQIEISHKPLNMSPLPEYSYKGTKRKIRPKKGLYVVTDFGAKANGHDDDTPAFVKAIKAAAKNGGGTVFVPSGTYHMAGNLTIPKGVLLRGPFDVTPLLTSFKGALLNVVAGRGQENGTPFIQMSEGSGLAGLGFHYPEQIVNPEDDEMRGLVPYPFLIRGLGKDIEIRHLGAILPFQLIDLATHRCDDHIIDGLYSSSIKTGISIGKGSTGGQLHNVQFNITAYSHNYRAFNTIEYKTATKIRMVLDRISRYFIFGDVKDQVVHQCFTLPGNKAMHLIAENGVGPSLHCRGFGADGSRVGIQVDAVGSGGFQPINTQIVGRESYVRTGPDLKGDFKVFGAAAWGGHDETMVLEGGNIEFQQFHLQRYGKKGTYFLSNDTKLTNFSSNISIFNRYKKPLLVKEGNARATFVGGGYPHDESAINENSDTAMRALYIYNEKLAKEYSKTLSQSKNQ